MNIYEGGEKTPFSNRNGEAWLPANQIVGFFDHSIILIFAFKTSEKGIVQGSLFRCGCQLIFTCSKSTIETLDKGVIYVQR